jgi:hypothetical protein
MTAPQTPTDLQGTFSVSVGGCIVQIVIINFPRVEDFVAHFADIYNHGRPPLPQKIRKI